MKKYTSVDTYIADLPPDARHSLQKLRKTIRDAAPQAGEKISYGMPTFMLHGKYLVHFAAWKNHVSIYPATSRLHPSMRTLLRYRTGKGTFQFPVSEPLPLSDIKKFVTARIKELKQT